MAFALIATFLAMHSSAQDMALQMTASNHNVSFAVPLNVTDAFQTVSVWIKPNNEWNTTTSSTFPLIVKDKFGLNSTWGGRFAIYFEGGQLKWTMADFSNTAGSTIVADQREWQQGRWYHLAFVIHPVQGMKMYVNGILQQDTDPRNAIPPGPNEGPDEPFHVGCWGNQRLERFDGEIDELRFWATARTQAEIQNNMCRALQCANYLIAGYSFNWQTPGTVNDVCGIYTVQSEPLIQSGDFRISSAPLGEVSSSLYASDWSTAQHTVKLGRDTVSVYNVNLPAGEGIHIYRIGGYPEFATGLMDTIAHPGEVIGVWCSDTSGRWDMRIGMGRNRDRCTECAFLAERQYQNDDWFIRNDVALSCGFNCVGESVDGAGWREEYYVIDELRVRAGLPDTMEICANSPAFLRAPSYGGRVDYLWDNGNTSFQRAVSQSGSYWLTTSFRNCSFTDTIVVLFDSLPSFDLPEDTVICQGDTIEITCPLPGVKYEWSTGDTTQSILVWKKGFYHVQTTYGRCQFTDFITVQVIPELTVELGPPDTALCLGQRMHWNLNPEVGRYTWYDGSNLSYHTLFNDPGTYWVTLENECFLTSDTIQIDWYDCDCRVDIPTAFTPNADYVNDNTGVYTRCYFEHFEYIVMDRWGNVVYRSEDPQGRWDGTYGGAQCPQGVYAYRLEYRRWTGPKEPVVQTGTMMLIR